MNTIRFKYNLVICATLLLSLISNIILFLYINTYLATIIYYIFNFFIVFCLPIMFFIINGKKHGIKIKKTINYRHIYWKKQVLIIVFGIIISLLYSYLISVFNAFLQFFSNSLIIYTKQTLSLTIIFSLILVTFRSIASEIIFRGVGYTSYEKAKIPFNLMPIVFGVMLNFKLENIVLYFFIGIIAYLLSKKHGVIGSVLFVVFFEAGKIIFSNAIALPYDSSLVLSTETALLYGFKSLFLLSILCIIGFLCYVGIFDIYKSKTKLLKKDKTNKSEKENLTIDEKITTTMIIILYVFITVAATFNYFII